MKIKFSLTAIISSLLLMSGCNIEAKNEDTPQNETNTSIENVSVSETQ